MSWALSMSFQDAYTCLGCGCERPKAFLPVMSAVGADSLLDFSNEPGPPTLYHLPLVRKVRLPSHTDNGPLRSLEDVG